ncbi:Glyoxylate/hydroxypyruvate reductase A [Clostridium sp. N3C]|uniref:D-2-hydroxyacid dehydrogenase n=1 Tax=Clostridium sp. N3C TaxID=1776758 RepID=UPI00092DFD3A|nr:D-2-hydroxyacid dehydrogenase [Clostridium sp. N3C]SCN24484.1 Glyoxylate/hydroxypyruvate reductase A [Clostridium sp. N3C]
MEINKILITGRLYKEIEEQLQGKLNKEILSLEEEVVRKENLQWADAFVAFRLTANFDFYNIKWVHSLGAGVDGFLFQRHWKEDVLLTRTICSFGKKISEYCLSYILASLQQHDKFRRQQENCLWQSVEPISMEEQNILILGTGVIGQELAKNLSLLGSKITGISLSGTPKLHFNKVIKFKEIKRELPRANWIINTLPLTNDTFELLDENIFANSNKAGFINVGRGKTVKTSALLDALERGSIKEAVLDVFDIEPLPKDSPLWSHPKIKITPHISAITTVEEGVKCFLETLSLLEKDISVLTNKVNIKRGY